MERAGLEFEGPIAPPGRGPELELVSVAIGRWAVAFAPARLCTLVGSCVGVALHDRSARLGGLAHVVLPEAPEGGPGDWPGKYADTAISALVSEIERRLGGGPRGRLTAKIVGGARMLQFGGAGPSALDIGRRNLEAIERALGARGVPILARDVGGTSGRRIAFDAGSGVLTVRPPGGGDYDL